MREVTCPDCLQTVWAVTAFAYPEGLRAVVENHGTDSVVVCPGSLKPAPPA